MEEMEKILIKWMKQAKRREENETTTVAYYKGIKSSCLATFFVK